MDPISGYTETMSVVEMAAAGGKPREMGKVIANISVANIVDRAMVSEGRLAPEDARRVELTDVLVDTGATLLCLPEEIVAAIGPKLLREVVIETALGDSTARIYEGVSLTVEGRTATVDCLELGPGRRPLLGVFPLEVLGIELDLKNQRLSLLPDDNEDTYLTVLNAR